jgi:hypothetical protein
LGEVSLAAGVPGDDQILFGARDAYKQKPQTFFGVVQSGG